MHNLQSGAPFAENTRFFTISTAGHVDHGKTSLLRALTGIDPDRLKEEKERQMTTDLGFAHLRLPGNLVAGFVDVPGHGRFLKNMLAGVGGLDMALLVVAADEGPMPQTIQHVRILSLLGVQRVLAVITKIDMCDEDQINLCLAETNSLIAEHGMQVVAAVRVSSIKGSGIEDLKKTLQTVLEDLPQRSAAGSAFLPVDRVFSKQGFGTVVTGTLVRGKLSVGDQISLAPNAVPGRVRRLETFGANVENVRAGQRVACNIVLKEQQEIVRGFVISGQPLDPARSLLVSILDSPREGKANLVEVLADQPVRFYHGTSECHGRIRWVQRGASLQAAIAFVALAEPLAAQPQDRFVVRLGDDSIYGGTILVREKPRWLNRALSVELSELLLAADFKSAVSHVISASSQSMLKESFVAETLLPSRFADDDAKSPIAQLISEDTLVKLGDYLMRNDMRVALSHQAAQLAAGDDKSKDIAVEKLRLALKPRLDRPTFGLFLEEEVAAGRLARKADRVHLPGADQQASVSTEDTPHVLRALDLVGEHLCIEATEIAARLKAEGIKGDALIDALVKTGRLARVDRDYLATPENIAKAHTVLADIWAKKRNITPGDFREGAGTTRKYAMALLAYFDDHVITRRLTAGRALLKPPASPKVPD